MFAPCLARTSSEEALNFCTPITHMHCIVARLPICSAQGICSRLADLAEADGRSNGSSPAGALLALLARLLFLRHSRPLHRVLLAHVQRLPAHLLAHFAHAFQQQACL